MSPKNSPSELLERSRRRKEAERVVIKENPPRYLGGYHQEAKAMAFKI